MTKNPNNNCLDGFKCPECGSFEPFRITCTATIEMWDDGSDNHEGIDWEDDSPCLCLSCPHVGTVKTFTS